jgi:two-component system sensor histidine kinase ChvG
LARIFDRYFSHRPQRASGDEHNATHFGIGLWVARRNVEALGGTISAENRKPHGLLMRVTLPLAQQTRLSPPNQKIAARSE